MRDAGAIHENFERDERDETGSNRSFGLVFTGFFAIIALWPLWRGGEPRWIPLAIAMVFLAIALAAPAALAPLNRLWMRFGRLLHAVVNPIVMAAIFFGVITPAALLMRAIGRDPLRLARDRHASSYWILRQPPGPAPDTMRQQF
jgi:predicted membrane metal-binding protein